MPTVCLLHHAGSPLLPHQHFKTPISFLPPFFFMHKYLLSYSILHKYLALKVVVLTDKTTLASFEEPSIFVDGHENVSRSTHTRGMTRTFQILSFSLPLPHCYTYNHACTVFLSAYHLAPLFFLLFLFLYASWCGTVLLWITFFLLFNPTKQERQPANTHHHSPPPPITSFPPPSFFSPLQQHASPSPHPTPRPTHQHHTIPHGQCHPTKSRIVQRFDFPHNYHQMLFLF